MNLLAEIADSSLLAFALLLFLMQGLAHYAGYRLGLRRRATCGEHVEGVGLIVGGILGLLAFVLALTLSYANSRFVERRQASLQEANAIETAWLRAQAIDHRHGAEIAKSLEQYTEQRKRFLQAPRHAMEVEQINQRTAALQAQIWAHATALSRERVDPIVAALMQSLNDTFDASTSERFAQDAKFPSQMFWLLIGLAVISIGALGYQLGLKGQRTFVLVAVLIAVWTAVIVVILDISTPRLGSIRTAIAVYDWTIEGIQGGNSSLP